MSKTASPGSKLHLFVRPFFVHVVLTTSTRETLDTKRPGRWEETLLLGRVRWSDRGGRLITDRVLRSKRISSVGSLSRSVGNGVVQESHLKRSPNTAVLTVVVAKGTGARVT